MEIYADRLTASDLHSSEVAVVTEIEFPYLLDGGAAAVDFKPRDPNAAHADKSRHWLLPEGGDD